MKYTENDIKSSFPYIFLYQRSLEFGPGWNDLVYDLCEKIMAIAKEKEIPLNEDFPFAVAQIKEKFGGLRVYLTLTCDEIDEVVDEAEELSYTICEVCGAPGKIYNDGWIETLCEEHERKRDE